MHDVRWSLLARADLDRIDDYYGEIDTSVANEIARRVVAATRFLSETPAAGPVLGDGPRRKWRVRQTPYVVIYRPVASHIAILRVRHTRDDWKPRP